MAWDITKPLDNGPVRTGDDFIRELKSDLELAISLEHSFPINSADPHGYHNIPYGTTAERPAGVTGQWYYNTTTSTIQRYSGSAWVDLTDSNYLPAGTIMIFCQTSAPTGWTRKTTINDRMLRAVTGATGGATGGAWGVTIAAANHAHDHGAATDSKSFSTAHGGGTGMTATDAGYGNDMAVYGTVSHNETGAHTHTVSSDNFNHGHTILSTWKPKYKDVILAEKD